MRRGTIKMKKTILGFCAVLLLALSACGGGGSTSAPAVATGNIINGTANLGVVANGVITAFKLTNGVKGASLGTATTNPDGTFTINVGTYTGPVLLVLSNPNSNATFINEATGTATALPTAAANSTVSSILPSVAANQPAAITPLTDIIATAAVNSAKTGTPTATAVTQASTLVAKAFGLNGIDPLTTIPANLKASAGTGNAAKYASVLAGIAKVAAANTTTTTVNNATGGGKLIAQTKAYANAMFNAQGQPQAPTTLTAGDNFATLQNAVATFKNTPPTGLQAPAATATPTGATYAGNSYYYVFQEYRDADANIDYMERGTITLDANASVTPLEAWDYTAASQANNGTVPAANLTAPFRSPLTVNQNGSWQMAAAGLGGNISADGLIFAGVGIKNGSTANAIIYGVKKPATLPTKAALAGKVFDFVSQGTAITGTVTETLGATGNITFSANGQTLTLVQTEAINGVQQATITTPNVAYTITPDGLLKITYPNNGLIYVATSEGLKYGVWSETNYNVATSRQLKSTGFAIARSNVTPAVANTSYNYFVSYFTTGGVGGGAGPQVEQGLLPFNATSQATVTATMGAMQQVTGVNTTVSCGVAGAAACVNAAFTLTFTGQANGAFTATGGGVNTFKGFVSADGNVAASPGLIAIKQ